MGGDVSVAEDATSFIVMLAELSATSADVVNGSQLYNTNQQVALNTSGLAEIGNNISTLQQDTLSWDPSLGAFSAKHGPTLPMLPIAIIPFRTI